MGLKTVGTFRLEALTLIADELPLSPLASILLAEISIAEQQCSCRMTSTTILLHLRQAQCYNRDQPDKPSCQSYGISVRFLKSRSHEHHVLLAAKIKPCNGMLAWIIQSLVNINQAGISGRALCRSDPDPWPVLG